MDIDIRDNFVYRMVFIQFPNGRDQIDCVLDSRHTEIERVSAIKERNDKDFAPRYAMARRQITIVDVIRIIASQTKCHLEARPDTDNRPFVAVCRIEHTENYRNG